MTRDEARRRAVEAAARALSATVGCDEPKCAACEQAGVDAIAAYERAMADAGWRMVRDCGKQDGDPYCDVAHAEAEGWNACRRAMLGED